MKTKQLAELLEVSEQDAQFILNNLSVEDRHCKHARFAGEKYRSCTINEDRFTIWNVLK